LAASWAEDGVTPTGDSRKDPAMVKRSAGEASSGRKVLRYRFIIEWGTMVRRNGLRNIHGKNPEI
jgi:hypothetical protein